MLADGFGQRADVMRAGPTTDAEVANAERERFAAEVGDLEAIAGERVERDRERPTAPVAVPVLIAQRLERRLALVRAIWHRERRHRRLHRAANLLQERHHRLGTADAV